MQSIKIVVEKHADCYVAYPIGIDSVIVGEGDSYAEAVADVQSAIKFHIESFGGLTVDQSPVLEAYLAEAVF